jgi:hypothetical protein
MSSITSLAVLAVVVLFGLPILASATGNAIDDAQDSAQDKIDTGNFGNNPTVGSTVCDLYIKVFGELDYKDRNPDAWIDLGDNSLFHIGQALEVYIGESTKHPEIATYEWSDCYIKGGNSFIPLIAYSFTGISADDLSLASTVYTFGDTFELEITGSSDNGNGLLTENGRKKTFTETVKIKDFEAVELPIGWSEEFFLTNVVVDDYTLEIRPIDQSLNNEGTNEVVYYDIIKPVFGN